MGEKGQKEPLLLDDYFFVLLQPHNIRNHKSERN